MFEQLVPACRDSNCGCDFVDVMQLVQNIMNFAIYLGTIVLVLILVYVGFLYVTNPASPANIQKAKSVATSAIIGFVVLLGAFLIVSTIMNTFAREDAVGNWESFFGVTKEVCETDLEISTPGGGSGSTGDVRVADSSSLDDIKVYIKDFIQKAKANGLRAVYEVETASQRQFLIDSGVPAVSVLQVRRITSPHFSVYTSAYGSSGTGSDECHECKELGDYGIQTKDGSRANVLIAEGLQKVARNTEIPTFRVTEAFPKTVSHSSKCHNDGTCVDVNFIFPITP